MIFQFDKLSGDVLFDTALHAAICDFSDSSVLNENFYENKANLMPFNRTKIRFIDCINDHIYMSDLGRSMMFKASLDGKTELAFGEFGYEPGKLNEPSGMQIKCFKFSIFKLFKFVHI